MRNAMRPGFWWADLATTVQTAPLVLGTLLDGVIPGAALIADSGIPLLILEPDMLHYTIVFLVVAIIAAVLGFGGIAGAAAGIAKILFFVFLILFVISLFTGRKRV